MLSEIDINQSRLSFRFQSQRQALSRPEPLMWMEKDSRRLSAVMAAGFGLTVSDLTGNIACSFFKQGAMPGPLRVLH